jgi:DNA recombination protein RmuC
VELLALVILIVMVAGFGFVIYHLNQKMSELKNDSGLGLIKQDLQGMSQMLSQSQSHMNDRLDKAAAVFGGLQNELGKMQELGRSLKDIQDVLKSPKLRGNIGEQLMADLIKQQIPRSSYALQYAFRSGEKVDAVIKTKNGYIPIDSKFPVENYLKYVQEENETLKARFHKDFESDVKKHIQVIAKKYILPTEGTVDFALMYVPGDAVWANIMSETNLSDYAASQRVYLVSPHSFYYFLRTVLLSLEGQLIEEKAKEVMNHLRAIQGDAHKFGSDLLLVNKHITNAKNASESAVSSYTRLSGRIDSANRLTGEATEQVASQADSKLVAAGALAEEEV